MSWTGHYVHCGNKHTMNFQNLNIQTVPGGVIQGSGSDTGG